MKTNPHLTVASVRAIRVALRPLKMMHLDRLASLSGVSALTIYKIKRGETKNPGIETCRAFLPHIAAAAAYTGPKR